MTIYNFYSSGRQRAICHFFQGFHPDTNAITCGDFNSHHRMWYGHRSAQHDRQLSNDATLANQLVDKLVVDLAFDLQNIPGLYTHFLRNDSWPSVIDLTFTQGQSCQDLLDWTLGKDFGSDHLSTHLHINATFPTANISLAWSKVNWTSFTTAFSTQCLDFSNLGSEGEIERVAENYVHALHKAIDSSVPKIRQNQKRRMCGWWNPELDAISRIVLSHQENSHRDPQNKDLAELAQTARNSRRNAIRAAKQSYTMLKLQKTGHQAV